MLGEAGRDCPVLVPNERGLDRALELGPAHIAIFGSATETFAQKNLNRSLDEQFAMFEPTVRRARDAGLDVRAYVSMCFGDPWEGEVPVEQVVDVGKRLFDLGASQLSLGDTIGVGTAGQVTTLIEAFVAAGMTVDQLAMHFHDTYGQALANTYSALQAGITTFDASAGGLGGCPYAKSATGNLATEDLVWLLTGLGIEHGVDLDAAGRDQRLDGRPPRPSQPVGRGPRAGTRERSSTGATVSTARPRLPRTSGARRPGHAYLQDRLALNTKSLAEHDVHFPTRSPLVSPGLFHFRAALDLLGQDWGGPPGHAEGSWDALVRRVRRKNGTVLISHEILAPRAGRGDRRAPSATWTAPSSTSSTPSATSPGRSRRPGRRASSRAASGATGASSTGSSTASRGSPAPSTCRSCSPAGAPACRPSRSTWSPCRRAASGEDLLWPRFCEVFGIDPAWAPLESTRPTRRWAWPRPR